MEDEKPQAELLGDALRYMGHDVSLSSNCDAALEVLASREVDLIITDILVPKRDGGSPQGGILLISRVRTSNDKKIRNLPIIAISGAVFHSRDTLREMLKGMGVNEFLEKPLNLHSLGPTIQSLINGDVS